MNQNWMYIHVKEKAINVIKFVRYALIKYAIIKLDIINNKNIYVMKLYINVIKFVKK